MTYVLSAADAGVCAVVAADAVCAVVAAFYVDEQCVWYCFFQLFG